MLLKDKRMSRLLVVKRGGRFCNKRKTLLEKMYLAELKTLNSQSLNFWIKPSHYSYNRINVNDDIITGENGNRNYTIPSVVLKWTEEEQLRMSHQNNNGSTGGGPSISFLSNNFNFNNMTMTMTNNLVNVTFIGISGETISHFVWLGILFLLMIFLCFILLIYHICFISIKTATKNHSNTTAEGSRCCKARNEPVHVVQPTKDKET